jgi:hypothetical protein
VLSVSVYTRCWKPYRTPWGRAWRRLRAPNRGGRFRRRRAVARGAKRRRSGAAGASAARHNGCGLLREPRRSRGVVCPNPRLLGGGWRPRVGSGGRELQSAERRLPSKEGGGAQAASCLGEAGRTRGTSPPKGRRQAARARSRSCIVGRGRAAPWRKVCRHANHSCLRLSPSPSLSHSHMSQQRHPSPGASRALRQTRAPGARPPARLLQPAVARAGARACRAHPAPPAAGPWPGQRALFRCEACR